MKINLIKKVRGRFGESSQKSTQKLTEKQIATLEYIREHPKAVLRK